MRRLRYAISAAFARIAMRIDRRAAKDATSYMWDADDECARCGHPRAASVHHPDYDRANRCAFEEKKTAGDAEYLAALAAPGQYMMVGAGMGRGPVRIR